MLSTFSSCVKRRSAVRWNPAVCLLAICCCGIACCEEPSQLPTLEPKKSTIKLEAPVQEALVGGQGRFLIAKLRDRREVVVLDLFNRFVSFTIPLGEDDVKLAAGMTRLHVVAPDSGLFQTWNLRTGERLREVAWPLMGHVKQLAMGSGDDQRLAVCFTDSPHPEDPTRWATIEFPSMNVRRLTVTGKLSATDLQMQASTDGNPFVAWATQAEVVDRGVMLIKQSGAQWVSWQNAPRYILPNEPASHLLTDIGVFTLQQ